MGRRDQGPIVADELDPYCQGKEKKKQSRVFRLCFFLWAVVRFSLHFIPSVFARPRLSRAAKTADVCLFAKLCSHPATKEQAAKIQGLGSVN